MAWFHVVKEGCLARWGVKLPPAGKPRDNVMIAFAIAGRICAQRRFGFKPPSDILGSMSYLFDLHPRDSLMVLGDES